MDNMEFTSSYSLKGIIKEVIKSKAGLFSLFIFFILIVLSIYAYLSMPYNKVKTLWNDSQAWLKYPRNAMPSWWAFFTGKNLPKNINLKEPKIETISDNPKILKYVYNFSYFYDDFPSEFNIFLKSSYKNNPPILRVYWINTKGDKIFLIEKQQRSEADTFYLGNETSIEENLTKYIQEKLGYYPPFSITAMKGLFIEPNENQSIAKGSYSLIVEVQFSDKSDTIEIEPIIYGKVYGIAGTDHLRRPLELGILWGMPVDLAFGLGASLSITIIQLILATVSGWYGGVVDNLIQRLTEIYMLLPFLPLMIMISLFYKLTIWKLLVVLIILSLFGSGIKTQRAMVLQVKTLPYIEAARTYGASNMRIVFLYIIPKILPPVIPGLIISIPSYIFLEAILSLFGVLDPTEPTLGRIIEDAFQNGALYKGFYYWVIEPSIIIILMAISFALLGFVIDKIVNPRLKEI
jgi:peptide/nickel transport system permease protein